MLKLQKNERNDVYIFSRVVVTYESLPASPQSFKRKLQNYFEKSLGKVMMHDEHSSFGAVRKCLVNKLGVDVLLLMLCRLRFCKSFESDNHVDCLLMT